MKNQFTLILTFVVFLGVALSAAVGVGTGDFGMPLILAVIGLAIVLRATVGRHLPVDMTLICMGIGGFYIMGKGFAYLNFQGFLFAGELMLAFGALGYFWRLGKGEFTMVPRTPMAYALLLFGVYALIHVLFDFRTYGIMAWRDSCVIYYTLFFFLAYQFGQSEQVQNFAPLILICMAIPGAILDFMGLVAPSIPIQLANAITVRGNPLFLNHIDAIHPAVFGLILFFATKGTSGGALKLVYMLVMMWLTTYMLAVGRGASFITFSAVALFLLAARQGRQLLGLIAGVVVMALVMMMVIDLNPSVGKERMRQIEDQWNAIISVGSKKALRSRDADTAQWRLDWWSKITHDVNQTNPVFGLGFGADIASEFHKQFFRTSVVSADVSRTRGAHNAFFTVLARMGWLGAILFCGVIGVQLWYFRRAMTAFHLGLLPPAQAFLWGSNLCSFVITFLQYSWEASYSAIPAWTCVGLSYAYLDRVLKEREHEAVEEAPQPVLPLPRRRLAQPIR